MRKLSAYFVMDNPKIIVPVPRESENRQAEIHKGSFIIIDK